VIEGVDIGIGTVSHNAPVGQVQVGLGAEADVSDVGLAISPELGVGLAGIEVLRGPTD
jgi:hypothetical protein